MCGGWQIRKRTLKAETAIIALLQPGDYKYIFKKTNSIEFSKVNLLNLLTICKWVVSEKGSKHALSFYSSLIVEVIHLFHTIICKSH